jgi:hypothetical protein
MGSRRGLTLAKTWGGISGIPGLTNPAALSKCVLWGAVTSAKCVAGVAHRFTASDKHHVSIADATQTGLDPLEADLTLSGWVMFTSVAAGTEVLIHKGGNDAAAAGYEVYRSGTSLIAAFSDGAARVTATIGTIAAGVWYHFAAVYDRDGNLTGYLNGTAGTPADISGLSGSVDSAVDFYIGSQAGANYAGAAVASIGWWARTRTGAEIAADYVVMTRTLHANLSAAQKVSLTSYWDFDERTISATSVVVDQEGANDLTYSALELFSNGDFETAGAGGADALANWNEVVTGTCAIAQDTVVFANGAASLRMDVDATPNSAYVTQVILTVGNPYRISVSAKASVASGVYVSVGSISATWQFELSDSFAVKSRAFIAASTNALISRGSNSQSKSIWVDDASIKSPSLLPVPAPDAMFASDVVGTSHATLMGRTAATGVTDWSNDGPNGSYATTVANSGSAGSGNNGTMTGFADVDAARIADVPSGRSGLAIRTVATSYVNCGDLTALNSASAFTLAFWFKQMSIDVAALVAIKYTDGTHQTGIETTATGRMQAYVRDGDSAYGYFDYSTAVNAGQWHHCAMVYDGTQTGNENRLKLFIDGVQQTLTFTGTIGAASANLATKNLLWSYTSSGLNGAVYDARVYSSALPSSVAAIMNDAYSGTPVGRWIDGVNDTPRALANLSGLGSLNHDGASAYETVSQINLGTTYSVTGWVKTVDTAFIVAGENTADYMFLQTGGSLYHRPTGASPAGVAITSQLDGSWHLWAVTRSGTAVRFYIDGVQVGATQTLSANNAGTFSNIGGLSVGSNLAGKLADLRTYSVQLSAAQLLQLTGGTEATGASPTHRWTYADGPVTAPGNGDPVVMWETSDVNKWRGYATTRGAEAAYVVNGAGGRPSLDFDGADDHYRFVGAVELLSDRNGGVDVLIRPGVVNVEQVVLSAADEAAANAYWMFGVDAAAHLFVESNDAGTIHRVTGNSTLVAGSDYHVHVRSSGTAWVLEVNRVVQTLTVTTANSGKWWGNVAGVDALTCGAIVLSTGTQKYFDGYIAEVAAYGSPLNGSEYRRLKDYFARVYGV